MIGGAAKITTKKIPITFAIGIKYSVKKN